MLYLEILFQGDIYFNIFNVVLQAIFLKFFGFLFLSRLNCFDLLDSLLKT